LRADKTASTHKINWVQSLLKRNLKPALEIVEEVDLKKWKDRERYYIQYFKDKGHDIINHTIGGDGLTMGNQTSFKRGMVPYNKGKGGVEIRCIICNTKFKVRPSAAKNKKYKCCSKECGRIYRSNYLNKGTFKKGLSPWNKGLNGYAVNSKNCVSVFQIDCDTKAIIGEYRSISEASRCLKINAVSISNVINGKSKTSGGFKWERNIMV
jgi:hypothetical protein